MRRAPARRLRRIAAARRRGAVLWGFGSALGFPVGMCAAADDSRRAAGRLSVVTSIGYTAFLAGPPFVGLLGNHVGTLDSLLAVAGIATIGVLMSGVLAPPREPAAAEPAGVAS